MADTEWPSALRDGNGSARSGESSTPRHSGSTTHPIDVPDPSASMSSSTTTSTSAPMRQLEFNQAMTDFKHMFPNMDREVIEAVLRANNGIVDATIDQLLTMNIDNNEDEDDLPERILLSVQRDVESETCNMNKNHSSKSEDLAAEESPPPYTEAIKSPNILSSVHRHRHHHGHRSSPTSPRRSSPRHHPHLSQYQSPTLTDLLDLETDDLALSNTDTKQPLPTSSEVLLHDAANSQPTAWNKSSSTVVSSAHSKRSSLRTSTRHCPVFSQDPLVMERGSTQIPHKSHHHRKVSWEAPTSRPIRSKSFNEADVKGSCEERRYPTHHRQASVGVSSPRKLPPYQNWNPPLLGTLPDDFLRLAPRLPQRIPLSTQKSDPGHVQVAPSSLHRSQSAREDAGEGISSKHSTSHHAPNRSKSFAATSSQSAHFQRSITQDISSDMIQKRMRENERRRRQASIDLDPELAQYLEDERLALILQNSEFLQELRGDEDFMRTLERERELVIPEVAPDPPPQVSPKGIKPDEEEGYGKDHQDTLEAFPFSQQLPKATEEDAEFLQKLKHMGKASKKQFAALARRFFSRKRKKSPRHLLRETLAPSMTNLLDEEEDEDEDVIPCSAPMMNSRTSGTGRSGFCKDGLPPPNHTGIV